MFTPQERGELGMCSSGVVPESTEHVFVPIMDALNQADEIWGLDMDENYIIMMRTIMLECAMRIDNAQLELAERARTGDA